MFNLGTGDKLEGIAGTANEVSYHISGVDGSTLIEASGFLGNAQTDLHDATAATRIYSVVLHNKDSSAITVTLQKDPSDAGTLYIFFSVSLGAGHQLFFDGQRCSVMDGNGAISYVYIAHTHDGDTLQLDGVNSDGGAFPFTTSGDITMADGQAFVTDKARARDGDGLFLEDDGGNGIEITDGGTIHMATQSGFSAYLSANQDIPDSTPTLVEFDSEEDDIQSEFNVAAHTFTVAKNGIYQVSSILHYLENIADTKLTIHYTKKNAAYYTRVLQTTGATYTVGNVISFRVPLVATDAIQVWTYHTHTEARQLDKLYCRFSVAKIA